jgi:hypothetical protein
MDDAGVEIGRLFPEPDMRRRPGDNFATVIFISSGAVGGNGGGGIEGEGRKSAVVAEADLRSEKAVVEKHAGSTRAAGVFDNG